ERRRWPGRSFVDERGLLVQALQRQADTGNRFVREPAPHLVGALIGQYQARPVRVESIVVECLIEQLDGADLFELEVNVAVLAGKPEILEPLPTAGSFVRRPPDQIRLGVVP